MEGIIIILAGLNIFGIAMLIYIHFTEGINSPRKAKRPKSPAPISED